MFLWILDCIKSGFRGPRELSTLTKRFDEVNYYIFYNTPNDAFFHWILVGVPI
jgi:hypothetical protein